MLKTRQKFWSSQKLFDLKVQLNDKNYNGKYYREGRIHTPDQDLVLSRAKSYGVNEMIIPSEPNLVRVKANYDFCNSNEGCYMTVGFVPWKARELWD